MVTTRNSHTTKFVPTRCGRRLRQRIGAEPKFQRIVRRLFAEILRDIDQMTLEQAESYLGPLAKTINRTSSYDGAESAIQAAWCDARREGVSR
jgi:hypothetical protein